MATLRTRRTKAISRLRFATPVRCYGNKQLRSERSLTDVPVYTTPVSLTSLLGMQLEARHVIRDSEDSQTMSNENRECAGDTKGMPNPADLTGTTASQNDVWDIYPVPPVAWSETESGRKLHAGENEK